MSNFWGNIFSKRVKTPTVIQMEAAECGAAALGIILGYYGKYISLEELRYRCGVSRDGCDAFNLIEAAKYYGLDAKGYKASIEDLKKLKVPCILYWKNNHFVILEGFEAKNIYINDPAVGPITVSYQDFENDYSNVVITTSTTNEFTKSGKPSSFWNLIKERLYPIQNSIFFFLITIQLTLILIGLAPPGLSRIFVDQIILQGMLDWKWFFISFMIFMIVLQAIFSGLRGNVTNQLSRKLSIIFSVDFLWHVLRLPYLFFSQRFGSEVINRMNLNNTISDLLTQKLSLTVINVILIMIYGLIMFQYDAIIASFGIVTAVSSLLLFRFIARTRANAYSRFQQEQAKSIGTTIDSLQNMEFIKATGTEAFCFSRVLGYQVKNLNNLQTITKKDIWLNSFSSFLLQFAGILLLVIGSWRIMEGHLSIGMLLALQMLMAAFLAPFSQLLGFGMQAQMLKIDMMRLDDVLHHPLDPTQLKSVKTNQEQSFKLKGKVTMDRVTFGYSPLDDPLIENFSITIEPGQQIALVGRTGSGKTTVAKLLTGLFTPWSGEIKYDDISLTQLTKEQFQMSIGWVDQDILIFSGSFRDNLTLWNRNITNDELDTAVRDAMIEETIKKRDQGYDSLLFEGGANLSQGERQRLEIARALLLNPSILILDEATSALDSLTEATIYENIKKRHCSCIIITHRLSTIKKCDKIYVLDKGKIIDQGQHEVLKEKEGIYKELVQIDRIEQENMDE